MAQIRHFSYSFGANEEIRITINGSTVRCLEGAAIFKIEPFSLNNNGGAAVEMQEGVGFEFDESYYKWRITNGATPQTIKVYIGDGSVQDSRLYGSIAASVTAGSVLNVPTDGSLAGAATATIPANGDRKTIVIQADINNAENLRVGETGTLGASRGFLLIPGASYPFDVTTAIDVLNTGATAGQVYRYYEIE